MSMVEKVARAIADNITAALPDGVEIDAHYAARAAIEAMMDPTDAMIMSQGKSKPENAATEAQRERAEALNNSVRKLAVIQWQEMIRAALKEEGQ